MDDDQILEGLVEDNPFNPQKAVAIYRYGSHVYGTAGPQSDVDIIMVSHIEEPYVQFHKGDLNCTVFSVKEFQKRLDGHDITMLECVFLPDRFIIQGKDYDWNAKIETYKLRRAISAKSSNSFVKAKKKFTIEEDRDIYLGKKSLFHALRIPMIGRQIAVLGRIVDYGIANHYWPEIRDCAIDDWKHYKKKYQPIYNGIMSEFRRAAPK